jgi:large subunit ribosomal protein L15
MALNELSPIPGSKRPRKRVGRGTGSGTGKTAGRGQKGQRSRSGGGVRLGFEGGQMPLTRRLPKRGFHNRFAKDIKIVQVGDLSRFEAGSVVDVAVLQEAGLVGRLGDGVKLLANGDLSHALTVKINRISKSARAKVEAAGGTVELV